MATSWLLAGIHAAQAPMCLDCELLAIATTAWAVLAAFSPCSVPLIAKPQPFRLACAVPNYWESRWGTRAAPIIIEAADGPGTVTLASMNVYDVRQAGAAVPDCRCSAGPLQGMLTGQATQPACTLP